MSIGVLVVLVFIAVTAGVVGLFMFVSGRSQVQREKAIQNRLQDIGGGGPITGEDGDAKGGALLLKEIAGPMPNMDRVATAALKGSGAERWLQQSGTAMSISAVILTTLMFGVLAAIGAFMFFHLWWAAMVAFVAGLGIQPLLLKHKRSKRIDKFEEHFP